MEAQRNRIIGYADAMVDCYCRADLKIAIFDGLQGGEINGRIGESFGGYAYVSLCGTLMEDLIRDIWAFTLDRAEKTPSLTNVWSLMQSASYRESQRAWFSEPPESFWDADALSRFSNEQRNEFDAEIEKNTRERLARYFDDTMNRLETEIPTRTSSPLARKLTTARMRAIAHYEMQSRPGRVPARFDWGPLGISWAELKEFVAHVETSLFDMAFIATRGAHSPRSLAVTNRVYASDFWSRLLGNGPVREPPEETWSEIAKADQQRLNAIFHGN